MSDLNAAIERARKWEETATPEQKAAMATAQRASWCSGEMGPTDGMGTVYSPSPRPSVVAP